MRNVLLIIGMLNLANIAMAGVVGRLPAAQLVNTDTLADIQAAVAGAPDALAVGTLYNRLLDAGVHVAKYFLETKSRGVNGLGSGPAGGLKANLRDKVVQVVRRLLESAALVPGGRMGMDIQQLLANNNPVQDSHAGRLTTYVSRAVRDLIDIKRELKSDKLDSEVTISHDASVALVELGKLMATLVHAPAGITDINGNLDAVAIQGAPTLSLNRVGKLNAAFNFANFNNALLNITNEVNRLVALSKDAVNGGRTSRTAQTLCDNISALKDLLAKVRVEFLAKTSMENELNAEQVGAYIALAGIPLAAASDENVGPNRCGGVDPIFDKTYLRARIVQDLGGVFLDADPNRDQKIGHFINKFNERLHDLYDAAVAGTIQWPDCYVEHAVDMNGNLTRNPGGLGNFNLFKVKANGNSDMSIIVN